MIITDVIEVCPSCGRKVNWFKDYDVNDKEFYECSHCHFMLKYKPDEAKDYQNLIEYIKSLFPVKVGDKIYKICSGDFSSNYNPYIIECVVNEISWKLDYSGKDIDFAILTGSGRIKFTSFGSTWFHTRYDAEEYLRRKTNK